MELVFVYGTLKRGHGNNRILEWGNSDYKGKYVTDVPYPLFVDGLPYLLDREGAGKHVLGEVWNCDESTMKALDRLEGHPTFYKRRKILVCKCKAMIQTKEILAWAYFYQGKTEGKKYVSEYKRLEYSPAHV